MLFWSLGVYLFSFPPAEDHRWMCSSRAAQSLWNIRLQLLLCAHVSQQLQEGCLWSDPLFFLNYFFLTVCLLHGYVWTVLAASGSPFPTGARCFAGLGSLHLVATNTFWNIRFLLCYRFISLGHFSIIRMLMGTSSCSLLVKLVYLEVIYIFPFSGFSNKRFKLFYVVLLNTIFCAAFLCFSLEVPLLQFAPSF